MLYTPRAANKRRSFFFHRKINAMHYIKGEALYFALGWSLTPFVDFFTKYVYSDFDFLVYLSMAILVDTCLGFMVAVKHRNVDTDGLQKLVIKIITYGAALIISHNLVSFTVHGRTYIAFSWFDTAIFSTLMVKEALSIFKNMALLDPDGPFSPILKYLKEFDSITGKFKTDKNNDDGKEPPKPLDPTSSDPNSNAA